MKVIVSLYTEDRIKEIISKACVRAWEVGFDYTEERETIKQEASEITRKIINVISEYPERVVEL